MSGRRVVLVAMVVCALPFLRGQGSDSGIVKEIKGLRSLSTEQRPVETVKVAGEISSLPAGKEKLELADALSNLVTEGDQGHATIQAVADTLAKALAETPVPAKKGEPPTPYFDLARLVRYEHVRVALKDSLLTRADRILAEHDADAARANFTLKDLKGKSFTLSALRGKVVVVNFWATWCPPCRAEMPSLDALYGRFKAQGLVVLSISDEDPATVRKFLSEHSYHPPVLIDPGDKVHKLFHVEGIPHTFVFGRDGKLVAQAIDERTEPQFLRMLAEAGLHP